jgi:hypothetical protein
MQDYDEIKFQGQFPQEFFIPIEGEERREGRIIVYKGREECFSVDIDIVQKNGKKIWQHVDRIYNLEARDEIIQLAVQKLSWFLSGSKY